MKFKITGVVREKESKTRIPGLLVRSFDKDLFYDDLLGNAITGSDGTFAIGYEGKDFQELFEKRPDIYLVIYGSATTRDPGVAGDMPIYTTKRSIRFNAGRQEHFVIEIPREQLGSDAPGAAIVPTPEPDEWKGLIDEYIRAHPIDYQPDPEKGFAAPKLHISLWDRDPKDSPDIGESQWQTFRVTNRGNSTSFSTYVQVYEGGENVFGVPWREFRLCDYRILTIGPGQTIDVKLRFTRQLGFLRCLGLCFDPFLDPPPPVYVQYDRHNWGPVFL